MLRLSVLQLCTFMLGPAFRTFNRTFKSVFESGRVFASRDEFGRLRHYPNISKIRVPTRSDSFQPYANFLQKLGSERVGTSSEGSDITEIFPKFEKSQFPKLAKMKILEKNV
jgi:hypothetical protein